MNQYALSQLRSLAQCRSPSEPPEDPPPGTGPHIPQHFAKLRKELIQAIVALLRDDKSSLMALRLTHRRWGNFALFWLFKAIHVRPTEESAAKAIQILSGKYQIRPMVLEVTFTACPTWQLIVPQECGQETHRTLDHYDNCSVPKDWMTALRFVNLFERLRLIRLQFSSLCLHPLTSQMNTSSEQHQELIHRNSILEALLQGIQGSPCYGLALFNLQDICASEIVNNPSSRIMISRLRSLDLLITAHSRNWCIDRQSPDPFFSINLPDRWLRPIAQHLAVLSLSSVSELPWGYLPDSDILFTLHFPQLKGLTLINMIFYDDKQLHWILSHSATLRLLKLADCPILTTLLLNTHHSRQAYRLTSDQWRFSGRLGPDLRGPRVYENEARWATYLHDFERVLSRTQFCHLFRNPCPGLEHQGIGKSRGYCALASFDDGRLVFMPYVKNNPDGDPVVCAGVHTHGYDDTAIYLCEVPHPDFATGDQAALISLEKSIENRRKQ